MHILFSGKGGICRLSYFLIFVLKKMYSDLLIVVQPGLDFSYEVPP
jgi:hypothetical protein